MKITDIIKFCLMKNNQLQITEADSSK